MAAVVEGTWLYVHGASPAVWTRPDIDRLVLFLAVMPLLVLLVGQLRDRSEALRLAEAATREAHLERDLNDARARLARQETLATVGALVNGIAHEMRTPLTAIRNDLHILERRLADTPPEVRARWAPLVADAIDNAARLERLVERLRPHVVVASEPPTVVDLRDAVEDALRILRVALPCGHRVQAELAPAGRVNVEVAALQQILQELLKNALEASAPDAPVVVATRAGPSGPELAVTDRGPGIPPEVRARIYDEFVTTKPGAKGLGLSIVRRHAERHRVGVEIASGPEGTTITLRFPPVHLVPVEVPARPRPVEA